MAARINPQHDADTRAKIKTSQLVNRLNDIALGEADAEPARIKAIEILLRKTLPDLSNVTVDAAVDGKLTLTVVTGVPRAGS